MGTKKVSNPITPPTVVRQIVFGENSCSDKVSESGHHFFYAGGLLGELNTIAVLILAYRPILVVNIDAAIQYVAMSQSSVMAVPAGGGTGIPIPPNGGSIMLASGPNTYIRSSNVNVFGFMAQDNVIDDIS